MKITIDTNNDSKDEIRKTIEFLQKLVDHGYMSSDSGSSQGEFDLTGLNMDNEPAPETPSAEETPSQPSSGGMFNMFNDNAATPEETPTEEPKTEEKKEDIPSIYDLEEY